MKKITLTILALTLLISACKKEETTEPNNTIQEQPFQHLKVGNKWVYSHYYNGNLLDSLVAEVLNHDNGVYEIKTEDRVYKQHTFQYVEGSKLKQYTKGSSKQYAATINDSNTKVGDTWNIKDKWGKDSVVYKVESIDEKVQVPLGEYTCRKIVSEYANGWIFINYVNNKLGIIKIVTKVKNSSNSSTYELREINF